MTEPELALSSSLIKSLERGALEVTGLTAEDLGLLLSMLQRAGVERAEQLIVVTPTEEEAALVAQAGCAYLGEGAVCSWRAPSSPFSTLRPSRAQEGQWLYDLSRLASGEWPESPAGAPLIWAMPISALAQSCPPPERLRERTVELKVDQEHPRDELIAQLSAASYERVERVTDPGTFAVRGELIDLFAPQHERPYRLSFWGDELQEIKAFDPSTQHSLGERRSSLELSAARALRTDSEGLSELIDGLHWLNDDADEREEPLDAQLFRRYIAELERGALPFGVEACLPRATEEGAAWLSEYLAPWAESLCLILYDAAQLPTALGRLEAQWAQERSAEQSRLLSAPLHEQLCPFDELSRQLFERVGADRAGAVIRHLRSDLRSATLRFELPRHLALRAALDSARATTSPLAPLLEQLELWAERGVKVLIACAREAQRARLSRLLTQLNPTLSERPIAALIHEPPEAQITLALAPLNEGWSRAQPPLILLTAAELLAQPIPAPRAGERHSLRRFEEEQLPLSPFVEEVEDLVEGSYVVHVQYGVARYRGVEQLTDRKARGGPVEIDCVRLEFARGEQLLLPVYKLHLLQRFIGAPKPRLGSVKEGDSKWAEAKAKAREEAQEQAHALLELYAERAQQEGITYSSPDEAYHRFEEAFPHQETPDQLRAIKRILAEMCAPNPMDHLLCGDVGFGKTEVAMRAAMKALLDGKQVAVLVPTTILAAQHTKSFRERFKGTPYRIEQLSRFVSAERKREVREALKEEQVQVVIGTQSLLQDQVFIPQLGLLILDEEHRFGVKDKERLKRFKSNLDVLSMTATPIPRTLHLSISGLRSMSILSTPPRDRLSIHTQVSRVSAPLIRSAILNELSRGGQVFYVYNRVETIETRRAWLQSVVPGVTIDVAHGKMRSDELEEVMQRFVEGRSQVLLCTTLIETGIDIPRANTMLIDKAHTFGLAQLYQLRGRVGRSHERARCYLLIPSEDLVSEQALERLNVLQRFTELGSGFHIASHDLELRGAGELLGTKQNGQSHHIGLELYQELLNDAIAEQQNRRKELSCEPKLSLPYSQSEVLPDSYIEGARERLSVYRRLAQCRTLARLTPIVEELRDRFGAPPLEAEATLCRWRVLILARELGVEELSYERGRLTLTLHIDSDFPHVAMRPVSHALGLTRFNDLKDGIWRYELPAAARSAVIFAADEWLTHMHDHLSLGVAEGEGLR